MRVLVTGATGFVGKALVRRLATHPDVIVRIAARSRDKLDDEFRTSASYVDLTPHADWSSALKDIGTVVHAAARVHVMSETAANPLEEFRAVNTTGTLNLARQAVAAGVKRFVFVSTVKVNGETTMPGRPFTADDAPAPQDAYGLSKYEAEVGLRNLAEQTGMELVIVRPPLVYGPGVKANFEAMMRWLARGVPLPLGRIQNARSMVARDNLVDLLVTCLTHPAAAGQTFLVSDGEDVSTTELLRRMGLAMGKPARLLPVPATWLQLAAAMLGKRDVAQRLCGSLQVDIEKTRRLLGWRPPLTLDQGLKIAAEGWQQ